MKIKNFIRSSAVAAIIALLCVSLVTLPTLGCPSQSTIASLTQTLGTAAANIATLEGNSALGAKLTVDTAAAVSAVTNWKSGSNATMAIEALSLVEDDLNLIPGTSQYTLLIDLAIGTVQSILAMLPQSTTAAAVRHTARRSIVITQPSPKTAKAFRHQWNEIIAVHPELTKAKL